MNRTAARAALDLYEVDEEGLDRLDRAVLEALVYRYGGGPVGLSTLAVVVGEEAETVEVVAEPFLVRRGLLARTPRGRVATPAAWQHLGLTPPDRHRRPGPGHAVRLASAATARTARGLRRTAERSSGRPANRAFPGCPVSGGSTAGTATGVRSTRGRCGGSSPPGRHSEGRREVTITARTP